MKHWEDLTDEEQKKAIKQIMENARRRGDMILEEQLKKMREKK